jgi:hypothetical protein
MRKTIKQINSYVFDERFYTRVWNDTRFYVPSVTYILSTAYPQEYGLVNWRGDVGNKRADEIMYEAAEDGSYVHKAIEEILQGKGIHKDDIENVFQPKRALKVMRCLRSFVEWYEEYKPDILKVEYTLWNGRHKFAGTVDLKCMIGDEMYVVDFKTGKSLHTTHKMQIAAYGMNQRKIDKVALLHLGNTTKKGYSFKVLSDDERKKNEKLFKKAHALFKEMYPDAKPNEETFPEVFKI